MITLYRCIRCPQETLVTFDGSEDHLMPLARILQFRPRRSSRQRSCEKGYYAYISGQLREKREEATLAYLSAHFQHPQIELLLFESTLALPSDRPSQDWYAPLQRMIHDHYAGQGYLVVQGGLAHEVYRKQPQTLLPDLQAYEGVTFRVRIRPNYIAELQVDACYRFHFKGKHVREQELFRQLARVSPDVLTRMRDFATRDTDSIYQLGEQFAKAIRPVASPDGLRFKHQPLTADSLGFETWLWSHETPVQIEVGGGIVVPLAKHALEYNYGFYALPNSPLIIFVVHPSEGLEEVCPFREWQALGKQVERVMAAVTGNRIDTEVMLQGYSVSTDPDQVALACQASLQGHPGRIPLFLLIAPPKQSRVTEGPLIASVDKLTRRLEQKLRRTRRGTYTVTLGWDGLVKPYDRELVVENAILKGVTVLGGIPWRIANVPQDSGQKEDLCFIGVDVSNPKGSPVVGGVVLDAYGTPRGYHMVRIPHPDGDRVDARSFGLLLDNLLRHYQRATELRPQHIVIHRDGFVRDERQEVLTRASKLGIAIDLIEVRKSGVPRLKQSGNVAGTPSKDIAIGSEEEGVAYLVNTLTSREKLSSGSVVFPAPDAVGIYRVVGRTSMKTLAAQTHMLSLAHYGSSRRTERLPITVVCADALVNNASLKQGRDNFGRVIDSDSLMYWL